MTKIVSWNVNGIRAVYNKGALQSFLAEENPDILCLQETKAERSQAAEIDLAAYDEQWSSAAKKGYSGTAIFSKKPLSPAVSIGFPEDICKKYHFHKDSYGDPNAEGRVITAEYKDFYLVNVYTPNSKPDLSRIGLRHKQWDPAFLEHIRRLDAQKPVIFCGDLNVAHTEEDLANPKGNKGQHGFTGEEREGIDNIIEAGFVDAFRHFVPEGNGHYTWWSHFAHARERNVGWRIDYFFVSERFMKHVKNVEILDQVLGSDHCPVVLTLSK